jgi:hypothetical protein
MTIIAVCSALQGYKSCHALGKGNSYHGVEDNRFDSASESTDPAGALLDTRPRYKVGLLLPEVCCY